MRYVYIIHIKYDYIQNFEWTIRWNYKMKWNIMNEYICFINEIEQIYVEDYIYKIRLNVKYNDIVYEFDINNYTLSNLVMKYELW